MSAARPRSSTSATWTRKSGSSTRASSLSLCRSATGWKAPRWSARRSGLPGASTCARRRRGPNGKPSKAIAPVSPSDWFPNGVDGEYFAPSGEAYDAGYDRLRRPNGLLPEPGVHVRFLRQDAASVARTPPIAQADDRRRRSFAARATARRAPGCQRDRIGARRSAVSAPLGADGRAARTSRAGRRTRSSKRWRGRPGRDQPRCGRRRRRRRSRAFPCRVIARRVCGGDPAHPRRSCERQRLSRAGRAACCRITPGTSRCSGSTPSSTAVLRARPDVAGRARNQLEHWL